jgi:hypothetical protein
LNDVQMMGEMKEKQQKAAAAAAAAHTEALEQLAKERTNLCQERDVQAAKRIAAEALLYKLRADAACSLVSLHPFLTFDKRGFCGPSGFDTYHVYIELGTP